jgi:hypothetical protein
MASLKEGTENQSYEPVTEYSNVPVVPEYPNPYDNETTSTTNKLNEGILFLKSIKHNCFIQYFKKIK